MLKFEDKSPAFGLNFLVSFNRSCTGKNVLPWIYSILINHSCHLISEEPVTQTLNSLIKVKFQEVVITVYDPIYFTGVLIYF